MHVYVLKEPNTSTAERVSTVWGGSVVKVLERDWYGARDRAFKHAHHCGYKRIAIMCGPIQLFHRAWWNGLGEPSVLKRCDTVWQHNLWVWMERYLYRYAHVYIPPLSCALPWRAIKKYGYAHVNNPVPPLLAGYQVEAVMRDSNPLLNTMGLKLCSAGHDAWTDGHYFHHCLTANPMDEHGVTSTWNTRYEQAIAALIQRKG